MNELAGLTSGTVTELTREQIARLEAELRLLPQIEPPVRHFFARGLYGREMFMPAGSLVIGGIHLVEHICMVLGDVSVYTAGQGLVRIAGCETFVSPAGGKRALLAHTDTWFTTIHANMDDERDVVALEARFIAPNFEALDAAQGTLQ